MINWKKWMVYYINQSGQREGNEYVVAETRESAIAHYKHFFNVNAVCKAVPVYDGNKTND